MKTNGYTACIASVIQIGIGYPLELIKTQRQLYSQQSYPHIISKVYHGYGIRGFYHGAWTPFLMTNVSYQFLFHTMNSLSPIFPSQIWTSSIAGMMWACFINPLEIRKCQAPLLQMYQKAGESSRTKLQSAHHSHLVLRPSSDLQCLAQRGPLQKVAFGKQQPRARYLDLSF